MDSVPQLPLELLLLIFDYIFGVYADTEIFNYSRAAQDLGFVNPYVHSRRFTPIPLVCKLWNEASKPYLWKDLILREEKDVSSVASVFRSDADFAPHVRHLVIDIIPISHHGTVRSDAVFIIQQCCWTTDLFFDDEEPTVSSRNTLLSSLSPVLTTLSIRYSGSTHMAQSEGDTWLSRLVAVSNSLNLQRLNITHMEDESEPGSRLLFYLPLSSLHVPHLRLGWPRDVQYLHTFSAAVMAALKSRSLQRLELSGVSILGFFSLRFLHIDHLGPEEYIRAHELIWYSDPVKDQEYWMRRRIAVRAGRDDRQSVPYSWIPLR